MTHRITPNELSERNDTRTTSEKEPPDGWAQAAWDSLCDSEANRQANEIYERAEDLLEWLGDFLTENPAAEVDFDVLRSANVPLPSKNLVDHLTVCRTHFAGVVWSLEMMRDAVACYLPPRFDSTRRVLTRGRDAA